MARRGSFNIQVNLGVGVAQAQTEALQRILRHWDQGIWRIWRDDEGSST